MKVLALFSAMFLTILSCNPGPSHSTSIRSSSAEVGRSRQINSDDVRIQSNAQTGSRSPEDLVDVGGVQDGDSGDYLGDSGGEYADMSSGSGGGGFEEEDGEHGGDGDGDLDQMPLPVPDPIDPDPMDPDPSPNPGPTPIRGVGHVNGFKVILGKSEAEVQAKVDAMWNTYFVNGTPGRDGSKLFYLDPSSSERGYIHTVDTDDVRSEGMSYGMMIAVQLDKKEVFDQLWGWSVEYMRHKSGARKGYFAWQCSKNGSVIDRNSASDGEEYFLTALIFASKRWGDQGKYNYKQEALYLLDTMVEKDALMQDSVTNLFNTQHKMVTFVPYAGAAGFSDPSYHLPHFYEVWAEFDPKPERAQFWRDAAQVSREYVHKAAHSQTGLVPDYAHWDGRPADENGNHKHFRFDAWRVIMNVAGEHIWDGKDPKAVAFVDRMIRFFDSEKKKNNGGYFNRYELSGTPRPGSDLFSNGLIATNGFGAMISTEPSAKAFVQDFWDLPVPSGQWRYYNGMLYALALLYASGQLKAY